ncbi:unnamed protein product [Ectocarpus sp. CCAP 1310/34]|nr:unnamed protein product [Ectocarpus sp. CCAP 1310/34]
MPRYSSMRRNVRTLSREVSGPPQRSSLPAIDIDQLDHRFLEGLLQPTALNMSPEREADKNNSSSNNNSIEYDGGNNDGVNHDAGDDEDDDDDDDDSNARGAAAAAAAAASDRRGIKKRRKNADGSNRKKRKKKEDKHKKLKKHSSGGGGGGHDKKYGGGDNRPERSGDRGNGYVNGFDNREGGVLKKLRRCSNRGVGGGSGGGSDGGGGTMVAAAGIARAAAALIAKRQSKPQPAGPAKKHKGPYKAVRARKATGLDELERYMKAAKLAALEVLSSSSTKEAKRNVSHAEQRRLIEVAHSVDRACAKDGTVDENLISAAITIVSTNAAETPNDVIMAAIKLARLVAMN